MKKTLYVLACTLCALLVLPAAAQVPAYVPTDGLVGWWPFNGNANDESGNGNDGVVNGATLTEDRFGSAGKAYSFDGVSNFIQIENSQSLQTTSAITINTWVNFAGNGHGRLVSKGWAPNGIEIHTENNADHRIRYGGTFNGNGYGPISQTQLQDNQWYMVTAIDNGLSKSIFINGIQEDYFIHNYGSIPISEVPLSFGKNSQNSSDYLFGSLDDIAIYNRALTEQEIQNLYTGTTPPPCVSLPSNLQQGLVGYWPFCGNANDESGNGNDFNINGAVLNNDRFGSTNACFSFDGVDDFLVASSENLPSAERSVSLWYNAADVQNQPIMIGYGGANCGESWFEGLNISQTGGILVAAHCGVNQVITPYDSNQINGWHHLVITNQLSGITIFLDGVAIASSPIFNNTTQTLGAQLSVGVNVSPNGQAPYTDVNSSFFTGSLDDIGIWNRALTPEEVQELYTLDACTFTVYDTLTVYETVYDTVYTYETIYDTVTTYVTVTDTLLIDITFTGFEGQPSWLNTVTVFPNPASDHITIDYGNFALMAGYNTIITDAAGATVYSSAVNSQQVEIDINAWGATGVYYMSVYDASGELVAVRHIVLE